jgi:hypothetical protein
MAIFRKVHTQIWSDPFFSDLDSDKKIFYLYLLTNEKTKQCGVYEITKRHIAFDLGIKVETVDKLILYFTKLGKLKFSDETNEVAMKNWAKYNYSSSPKVVKCIESELKLVKNRVLIEYIYSIDTVSQEEEEEEQEQDDEKIVKKVVVDAFVNWFNDMKLKHKGTKGKFKTLNDTDTNNLLKLKQLKYSAEDWEHAFKMMLANDWVKENGTDTPTHFLVNTNFTRYLNKDSSTIKPEYKSPHQKEYEHIMKEVNAENERQRLLNLENDTN